MKTSFPDLHLAATKLCLQPQPLTADLFAPYGCVVDAFAPPGTAQTGPPQGARAINDGTTWRLDIVPNLDLNREGGSPGLAVYSALARQFPLALKVLERHQLGSQSFFPLTGARFVIVVAGPDARPHAGTLQAFLTNGQQGVVLHAGTWHHGLLAVDAGSFAVVERHQVNSAQPTDCDVVALPEPVWLELPGLPG